MKVLVTGATGFVGSHLAEALIRDGYEVRALVRPTSSLARLKNLNIEIVNGDIRDFDAVSLRKTKPKPPSKPRDRRWRCETRHLRSDHRALHRAIKTRNRAMAEALVRRPEHRLAQTLPRNQRLASWFRGLSIPFLDQFQTGPRPRRHVKKGEKSTPVIYYKILEKRDEAGNMVMREDGKPARIPFVRWANVFNLDQTEGKLHYEGDFRVDFWEW